MAESDEQNEEKIHDQRIENEIKKIILSLEHGENFIKPIEMDLPPEIEGQWLDYIQQFEEEFSKRKKILIYDLIGRPQYQEVTSIPETEIGHELEKLISLLKGKDVTIDTICPVDDRELYRFITEELFKEETDDIRIEGLTTFFIYEEFHPNHEHDVKNRCTEFVTHVLNKEREWMPDYLGLADHMISGTGTISGKEVIEKIRYFRDAFSSFTIGSLVINSVEISTDISVAKATCDLNYTGYVEGSDELMMFSGAGEFMLRYEHEWWDINGINIPGIAI